MAWKVSVRLLISSPFRTYVHSCNRDPPLGPALIPVPSHLTTPVCAVVLQLRSSRRPQMTFKVGQTSQQQTRDRIQKYAARDGDFGSGYKWTQELGAATARQYPIQILKHRQADSHAIVSYPGLLRSSRLESDRGQSSVLCSRDHFHRSNALYQRQGMQYLPHRYDVHKRSSLFVVLLSTGISTTD
jgi:hypothetical protein